jgi:hypothetical protein
MMMTMIIIRSTECGRTDKHCRLVVACLLPVRHLSLFNNPSKAAQRSAHLGFWLPRFLHVPLEIALILALVYLVPSQNTC